MKVKKLIKQLKKLNPELQVRIMNIAIEFDEACPTFGILDVTEAPEESNKFVTIDFKDEAFIQDEVNNSLD